MSTPPGDDLKAMFVVLEPPPGGLTKFRARREARRSGPWLLVAAVATAAALLVALRVTPPPTPGRAPVDLAALRGTEDLHPRWVGLGKVAAPDEPLTLAAELRGGLAARRVATKDPAVVFYMLEAK